MNREAEHEPVTVDWLIDTICPNKGNSPLMNYNKKRLRELIDRLVIEGQQRREAELTDELWEKHTELTTGEDAVLWSDIEKLLSQSSQQGANLQDTTTLTADSNEADNRSEVA